MEQVADKNKYKSIIIALSVGLPLIVAALYFAPKPEEGWEFTKSIPFINAVLNSITSLVLIAGFVAIRRRAIVLHQRLMSFALILSAFFLLLYVVYHATQPSTAFGGEGAVKTIYLFILLSHIVLAAVIAPLVLITASRAADSN